MKEKWYRFVFLDGYSFCCRGLSEKEIKGYELEHGKLLAKVKVDI